MTEPVVDIVLLAVAVLFLAIRLGTLVFLWVEGRATPRVEHAPAAADDPLAGTSVSVVIPAYNEEQDIVGCLEAITCSTRSPNLEVIVLDDKSTDRTLELVQQLAAIDGRIRGVAGADRPTDGPQWRGKNWACAQGATHAKGELLIFLDADVQLLPGAVEAVVHRLRQEGIGWLSLYPRIRYSCFWEAVVMPVVLIAQRLKINRANRRAVVYANGTFNIFAAETYRALGGHAAVGDQVRESSALAARAIAQGVAFRLLQADAVAAVRFYASFGEMWEGLIKSSRYIVRSMPLPKFVGAVVGIAAFSLAPIALLVYRIVHACTAAARDDLRGYPATAAAGLAVIAAAQLLQLGTGGSTASPSAAQARGWCARGTSPSRRRTGG